MKKRVMAGLLVFLLVLSMTAAGCGKKSPQETEKTPSSGKQTEEDINEDTNDKENESNEGTSDQDGKPEDTQGSGQDALPLCEEKQTLSFWFVWSNSYIESPNETPGAKKMEELTNVHIDYLPVASSEATEKFALMLASGNHPDMMLDFGYPGGGDAGIAEGVFVKLNDYVNADYMPNYSRFLEDEAIRKDTITDSGNIYAIYAMATNNFAEPDAENPWAGLMVRRDWLQDLNMETPVTIEDWEKMLTAFKEEKGAEAPLMIGSNGIIDGGNTIGTQQDEGYFISAYGILSEFYQKDGKVMYGPIQPEYKEYLTLMNDWYNKGLIDPNFMSNNAGVFMPNDYSATGKTGAGRGHFIASANFFALNGMSEDEDFFLQGVQAPVLNEGEVAQARNVNNPVREAFAISTSCKNVELAIRWLDYQFTREATLLNYYGVEGETYTINPETGIAEYNEWVLQNPDGYTAVDAHYLVGRGQGVGAFDYTKEFQVQDDSFFEAGRTWAKDGISLKLPDKMSMTAEEGSRFNSSYIDIQTYVQENTVKFITGAKPLGEFDAFVDGILAMDIEDCVALKQAALDRYNAR